MKKNNNPIDIREAIISSAKSQKKESNSFLINNHFFENYAPSELTDSYRILSTPSTFAKDTLFYIQEIGKLKSLKSHTSKRESLDSFLFFIVLSGSGFLTYEGRPYSLESGDCIFIDCKKTYSHESTDSDPWELMWVHFNGPLMNNYYCYFYNNSNSIWLHPQNLTEFSYILEKLLGLAEMKNPESELISSHLLNSIVTKILTENPYSKRGEINTITYKIKLIKDYIDGNFKKKIPLDMIADEFFISKYHMSREFKKAYGITIANYIIAKRITHAKELLRFSDLQIEEIGQKCGIKDNSYFNKIFRKFEGMTASDYRKKWRGFK